MNPHKSVQLDRFLTLNSLFSLQQVRRLILGGRVQVDTKVTNDIRQPINAFSHVKLNNSFIQQKTARYIMLNKPMGIVSATTHKKHKTVVDCITEPYQSQLHIAGRLDFNTTGLLILTNDGHWSRKLTLPQEKFQKTYLVQTEKVITDKYTAFFAKGMHFDFEDISLLPAKLDIIDRHNARLTIFEGRYHQIKRMFGHFNNKVTALHRESMGDIQLDPDLKLGEYRELNLDEENSVRSRQAQTKQSTSAELAD